MTRERGSRAESKNCQILLFQTADRRFDTKVKCPTGRASFWVKFPAVLSLTRVKCPGIARGGGGGRFWNCLVHCRLFGVFWRRIGNEIWLGNLQKMFKFKFSLFAFLVDTFETVIGVEPLEGDKRAVRDTWRYSIFG